MNPFQNNKQPKKYVEPAYINVVDFPLCCTARVLCEFDEEYGHDKHDVKGQDYYSEEQYIARCNKLIPSLKDDGVGVVVAITVSNQKEANKAFTRMGFYTNPKPMKKGRNKQTGDLFIWFMPTHEFKPVKL